jgi:non-homologous end joining protein Ku
VDLAPYKDRYREGLTKLVEERLAKEKVVASPEPTAQIINLMDALKNSVERTKPKLPGNRQLSRWFFTQQTQAATDPHSGQRSGVARRS